MFDFYVDGVDSCIYLTEESSRHCRMKGFINPQSGRLPKATDQRSKGISCASSTILYRGLRFDAQVAIGS
jgi:hypothetical protein